ncbi:MAG: SCP2 sterol-binding domain-containing protein [Ruminococcus sp.]|jgi:putative sterol carrier protein|nr:SCP2 sterol-binding domain-containing protein [Ruminococcus sp.]
MTFLEAFEELKTLFEKHDVSDTKEHFAYQFNITGDGSGTFYVEITDGKMIIRPYDYHDRDAEFTASLESFKGLATGKLDPVAEYLKGKIKIGGTIDKALKLKNILQKSTK